MSMKIAKQEIANKDFKKYYSILGVRPDADDAEIRKKYYELAKLHHPDRLLRDKESEEAFKLISKAAATLRDPSRRRAYDLGYLKEDILPKKATQEKSGLKPVVSIFCIGFLAVSIYAATGMRLENAQASVTRQSSVQTYAVNRALDAKPLAQVIAPSIITANADPKQMQQPLASSNEASSSRMPIVKESSILLMVSTSDADAASVKVVPPQLKQAIPLAKRTEPRTKTALQSNQSKGVYIQQPQSPAQVSGFLPYMSNNSFVAPELKPNVVSSSSIDNWPHQCPLTPACKADLAWCDC